jgi:hypothetical protein
MRTERCFSSNGLLEMLPIYQLKLIILGVYGSAQGMAIAVYTLAFCGTPMNTYGRTNLNYTGSSMRVHSWGLQRASNGIILGLSGNVPINQRIQDQIRLPNTKVSPEIQSPLYYTSQGITLQEFLKVVRSFNSERLLQTVKVKVLSSGKHTRWFLTRRQDGSHAKPGHDITRYHKCWPGMDPTPWTNHLEEHRAKTGEE